MLSRLFNKEEREGALNGVKICRGVAPISHLMYLDNLLITCRANLKNSKVVKRCLQQYCTWSRQEPNLEKSHVFFSSKMLREGKRRIKEIISIWELKSCSIYLGNALILGKIKIKEFWHLKEKIQTRLEGWQGKLLSSVGKATLIQSITQAIPTYTISTF